MTSATGAGHDTHAAATVAWCKQFYGAHVEVTIDHTLEDSHAFYRYGVDFYNFIQRRMPWFHHIYYNIVEMLDLLNPGTVGFGRDYYIRLLERTRPDVVLSVMDCLNRGYFELARTVLGPQVKCATYCPEFLGGYGFSRNWVNPRADYFFGRTKETAHEAIRRGMPSRQSLAVGHWAPPSFYETPWDEWEKSDYLRVKLQLDPRRFTLLLSTGGAGAQNHAAILRHLLPLGDRLQVIALCGRNPEGQAALDAWAKKEVPFVVRTLGFTDEMAKLLQVSSAVVARAGATTAGEALLCGCPMIFNGLGGLMPQELPTWRYFRVRDIGVVAHRAASIRSIVERWLHQPETYAQLRERIRSVRDATIPRPALDYLLVD
jgi:processive 1,2-diacylglycerol beta-glucosyltransferase